MLCPLLVVCQRVRLATGSTSSSRLVTHGMPNDALNGPDLRPKIKIHAVRMHMNVSTLLAIGPVPDGKIDATVQIHSFLRSSLSFSMNGAVKMTVD